MNIRKFPEKFVKNAEFIYLVRMSIELFTFSEVFASTGAIDWEDSDYNSKKHYKEYYLIFEKPIDIEETLKKIKESIEKERTVYKVDISISLSEEEIEYELPTINLEDNNNGRQKRSISNLRLRENLRSQEMCS